jgi:hypothetical protein
MLTNRSKPLWVEVMPLLWQEETFAATVQFLLLLYDQRFSIQRVFMTKLLL